MCWFVWLWVSKYFEFCRDGYISNKVNIREMMINVIVEWEKENRL